mmetsp:Transcript_1690/g.2408  ORF Transcript_1690/g.2408 Transcript_1690/m.2408 type:complete len:409 (+) Transcript_1690:73-1299(+)
MLQLSAGAVITLLSVFIQRGIVVHCFTPSYSSSTAIQQHQCRQSNSNIHSTATDTGTDTGTGTQDFRQTTTIPPTVPLSKNTFAGQIENAIITKYGEEDTQRVLQSWRLLEKDYEHREYVGDNNIDSSGKSKSKISPEESNCYQYTHSYVEGLTCVPFWDINTQPWATKLQKKYKTIRNEFLNTISNKKVLEEEGNNIWAGALTEEAGGYGEGWSTLVLMNRGMWDETNCNLFPQTAKAVLACGVPATEIFFASMKPHTDIKLHSDFTNFVLTSHLAVDIPESGKNKCRLSVGDDVREWINGEVMLFDTSIMHDAINESDQMRYILMFRVWHPDLTEVEKNALQLIYDCLEYPDLLSEDASIREAAEVEIEKVRTFPKLKTVSSGFGSGGSGSNKGGGKKKNKKKGKR